MHLRIVEVGDEHADLWLDLVIADRRVDGREDVTVGHHPALGLAVVSHFGLENRVEWFTQRPVAAQQE